MVYREIREGDDPNKGRFGGCCNRRGCMVKHSEVTPVTWYNHGTGSYYCPRCARLLNGSNVLDHTMQTYYGSHAICSLSTPEQVMTGPNNHGQSVTDLHRSDHEIV